MRIRKMTAVASPQLTCLADAFLSLISLLILQLKKHLKCIIWISAFKSPVWGFCGHKMYKMYMKTVLGIQLPPPCTQHGTNPCSEISFIFGSNLYLLWASIMPDGPPPLLYWCIYRMDIHHQVLLLCPFQHLLSPFSSASVVGFVYQSP